MASTKEPATTDDPVESNPKIADRDDKEDDDDDDDDDEDYHPELDQEAAAAAADDDDDDPMDVVPETSPSLLLAPAQQRAVDAAFQDLFGYSWGTRFQLSRPRSVPSRRRKKPLPNNNNEDNLDDHNDQYQHERLLVQILGPARAARILQMGGTVLPIRRRRPQALTPKPVVVPTSAEVGTTTAAASSTPAPPPPRYETKLFAGKKIQVPVAPSASASTSAPPSKVGGNLDSVLQQMAGPSKISTVAKTSADWDTFKVETGLEAELESKAQGKDAYLVKQDFLTRVDHRTFDRERDDRDQERAKRGK